MVNMYLRPASVIFLWGHIEYEGKTVFYILVLNKGTGSRNVVVNGYGDKYENDDGFIEIVFMKISYEWKINGLKNKIKSEF